MIKAKESFTNYGIMIEHLRHMAIFSAVADKGSFTEASHTLGIAPSRVSEAVSKLEVYLDTTLLNRTTRKVTLTSEGREFYKYTSLMVGEARDGLHALSSGKAMPSGTLLISVPSYLTGSPVLSAIGSFVEAYPEVHIDTSFHDKHMDPITDGFDVCIQGGTQDYHGLVSLRQLGELERVVVAGRDYYAKKPPPQHPKDLENWNWITYRSRERKFKLVASGGRKAEISTGKRPRLQVDNLDALHFLLRRNLGISVVPIEICRDSIADGSLIRLFEDWRMSKVHLFAVWADKANRTSLSSVFVNFLGEAVDAQRGLENGE
ncbi:MAG: LysR family transcriptional regulator [Pseudomonadota bacterium]